MTGLPVRVVGSPEGAAHGAALLAATGVGAFTSVGEACATGVRVGPPVNPGEDVETYADVHGVYRDLYPSLRASFHDLARFDT